MYCAVRQMGIKFPTRNPKAKANIFQTLGINLESLSLSNQSQPYQQTQTPDVGRGRQRYLEINTTLTAPIAMEIPSGGEANEIPDNGGTACQRVPSALFTSD